MPTRGHLRRALRDPGFRRLYLCRLGGQFGDGVFQASLAGTVLFNPERQAAPATIAAGFAVLLLPYSVLGPFAGVLLDRWRRQRILTWVNALRGACVVAVGVAIAAGLSGVAFYACALVILSLSRFVLSALSASLPRVVPVRELVTANAFSTTSGTLMAAVGAGAALGARSIFGSAGTGDGGYAVIAAAAALPYLLAALAAAGFARDALGPTAGELRGRESVAEVVRGLRDGARHVWETPPVRNGLAAIGMHRLCYGVTTVCALLLYRNFFVSDGLFRAGLTGLGQFALAVAIGGALASLLTPLAFRRAGPIWLPTASLAIAAVAELALVLPYSVGLLALGALVLGFVAQSIKLTVDTLVQLHISDAYRGRVFALYDTLFNVTLVSAAVLTASVVPADGRSRASVVLITIGYALTAVGYFWAARPRGERTQTLPAVG